MSKTLDEASGTIDFHAYPNLGISFMYKDAAKKEIDAGELIEVKVEDFIIEKEFNFIYMDDELYIKELIYFYEFLIRSKLPIYNRADNSLPSTQRPS